MANDQFALNTQSKYGARLGNAIDALQRAVSELRFCRAKMIQCYTPDNDWANVEAQFGAAAGKGQGLFGELDSLMGCIDSADTADGNKLTRAAIQANIQQAIAQIG